jgi:hypothetical protein
MSIVYGVLDDHLWRGEQECMVYDERANVWCLMYEMSTCGDGQIYGV